MCVCGIFSTAKTSQVWTRGMTDYCVVTTDYCVVMTDNTKGNLKLFLLGDFVAHSLVSREVRMFAQQTLVMFCECTASGSLHSR